MCHVVILKTFTELLRAKHKTVIKWMASELINGSKVDRTTCKQAAK